MSTQHKLQTLDQPGELTLGMGNPVAFSYQVAVLWEAVLEPLEPQHCDRVARTRSRHARERKGRPERCKFINRGLGSKCELRGAPAH